MVASRFIKGLSAAFTAPAGLSVITTTFPEGPLRNRALSVYTTFAATGFPMGLVLSGPLTEASWRLAMLLPAPITLAALAVAVLLTVFVLVERRSPGPLIRLGVLRPGSQVRAQLGAMAFFGSHVGFQFPATLYMQTLLGWSALHTAPAFLPAGALVALCSTRVGSVVDRFGTPRLIVTGVALMVVTGVAALGLLIALPGLRTRRSRESVVIAGSTVEEAVAERVPVRDQVCRHLPVDARGAHGDVTRGRGGGTPPHAPGGPVAPSGARL